MCSGIGSGWPDMGRCNFKFDFSLAFLYHSEHVNRFQDAADTVLAYKIHQALLKRSMYNFSFIIKSLRNFGLLDLFCSLTFWKIGTENCWNFREENKGF